MEGRQGRYSLLSHSIPSVIRQLGRNVDQAAVWELHLVLCRKSIPTSQGTALRALQSLACSRPQLMTT